MQTNHAHALMCPQATGANARVVIKDSHITLSSGYEWDNPQPKSALIVTEQAQCTMDGSHITVQAGPLPPLGPAVDGRGEAGGGGSGSSSGQAMQRADSHAGASTSASTAHAAAEPGGAGNAHSCTDVGMGSAKTGNSKSRHRAKGSLRRPFPVRLTSRVSPATGRRYHPRLRPRRRWRRGSRPAGASAAQLQPSPNPQMLPLYLLEMGKQARVVMRRCRLGLWLGGSAVSAEQAQQGTAPTAPSGNSTQAPNTAAAAAAAAAAVMWCGVWCTVVCTAAKLTLVDTQLSCTALEMLEASGLLARGCRFIGHGLFDVHVWEGSRANLEGCSLVNAALMVAGSNCLDHADVALSGVDQPWQEGSGIEEEEHEEVGEAEAEALSRGQEESPAGASRHSSEQSPKGRVGDGSSSSSSRQQGDHGGKQQGEKQQPSSAASAGEPASPRSPTTASATPSHCEMVNSHVEVSSCQSGMRCVEFTLVCSHEICY